MQKEKITYALPFILLCVLAVMGGLKPEFLIPGLKSIGPIRQIPNILIGSLFLLWITQGEKVLHNKQTKLYLAFFLLMVIDTALARNPSRALIITKGFTAGVMVYLATISFVDTLPKLKKLVQIFLVCNVFIAFLGIKGGGLVHNIPALCDENDFALLMNMLIPFSFFLGMGATKLREKVFYFGITGLFVTGVVVSLSRGGFVGLACVLLYCLHKIQKKSGIIVMVVLLAVVACFLVPQSYWDEMATMKEEGMHEGTGESRIYYWKNALKIFAHHPIIGVGPLNSGVWITTYDKTERGARDWGRAIHSVYFTLLPELGLVGAFLFLAIIYYGEKDRKYVRDLYKNKCQFVEKLGMPESKKESLSNQIRQSHFLSLALTGTLIGYLASGIFLSVLYYGWFWMIMMYTVILCNVTRRTVEEAFDINDQVQVKEKSLEKGYGLRSEEI